MEALHDHEHVVDADAETEEGEYGVHRGVPITQLLLTLLTFSSLLSLFLSLLSLYYWGVRQGQGRSQTQGDEESKQYAVVEEIF